MRIQYHYWVPTVHQAPTYTISLNFHKNPERPVFRTRMSPREAGLSCPSFHRWRARMRTQLPWSPHSCVSLLSHSVDLQDPCGNIRLRQRVEGREQKWWTNSLWTSVFSSVKWEKLTFCWVTVKTERGHLSAWHLVGLCAVGLIIWWEGVAHAANSWAVYSSGLCS